MKIIKSKSGMLKKTSCFAVLFLISLYAFSQVTYFSEGRKTITNLGAQSTMFYVGFVESVGQNCQNGVLYIAPDRKGLYVQLLSAKLTGKHLSRVDYSQPDGNGTLCNIELVEILE